MNFHIIIPARLNASRLPNKPLLDIAGKSLLERVFDRAKLCGATSITIATPDEAIVDRAKHFGAHTCLTSAQHLNGTDRLCEAVVKLGLADEDIVVNLQGDEPFVPIEAIRLSVLALQNHPYVSCSTVACPIEISEREDPNIVKVCLDAKGSALYFTRANIPHSYHHLGLYVYRVSTLKRYQFWEAAPPEVAERLEQLRLLWNGEKIHVSLLSEPFSPGVNTLQDLARVRELFVGSVV